MSNVKKRLSIKAANHIEQKVLDYHCPNRTFQLAMTDFF
jgi:hypothetical protein